MIFTLLLFIQIITGFAGSYEDHTLRIINFYNQHKMDAELNLQKSILEFTDKGFLRFKKYHHKNKLEYYSLNLQKVNNITFLGDEEKGYLKISTPEDLIIVQTFNDPKGNVDSMANTLEIPVKNLSVDELNFVMEDFYALKPNLLQPKK